MLQRLRNIPGLIHKLKKQRHEARLWRSLPVIDFPRKPLSTKRSSILLFTPEAGVHPHFYMMLMVGRTLQELGHEVWMTRCYRQFVRCPVMGMYSASFGIDDEGRHAICQKCAHSSLEGIDSYGIKHLDLAYYDDATLAAQYAEATRDLPTSGLINYNYDGVDYGALTAFEVSVALKKTVPDPNDPVVRQAWSQLIQSSIKSFLLTRAIVKKHGFTHVAYFNDYSIQLAAGLAGEREGAVTRLITQPSHRNVDRRRCVVYQRCSIQNHYWIQKRWWDWRDIPLPVPMVDEVAEDCLFRFRGKGSHIYSPPKSFGTDFAASSNTGKLRIVAYTSSPDEVTGGRESLDTLGVTNPPWVLTFPAPSEEFHEKWLRKLCDHVGQRDDVELIIRIHPREGANKRETKSSAHLIRLQNGLKDLPPNCSVVWPEDQTSSYDLAESADLVLVSWSTIGLEVARLGLPVLCSTLGISGVTADDFQEFAEEPVDYFAKLDQLLLTTPDFATLRRSYRWWHLFCMANAVDLGDLVQASDFCGLPKYHLPAKAKDLERAVLTDENIFDINLKDLQAGQNASSASEEEAALQKQCRRIFRLLLNGEDTLEDFILAYLKSEAGVTPDAFVEEHPWINGPRETWIAVDCNREVLVVSPDGSSRKFSPMMARLAFLGAGHLLVPDHWMPGAAPSAQRLASWDAVKNLA